MEQLVEVDRGLRNAEPGIVRENYLVKAACEWSNAWVGGAIGALLIR